MLVEEVVQKVAVISGISRTSVYRIVREYRSNRSLSEPKAYPSRKKITEAIDVFDRGAIRRKVNSFFFRNELPTVDKILKDFNEDAELPNFKRTSFYQLLKEYSISTSTSYRCINVSMHATNQIINYFLWSIVPFLCSPNNKLLPASWRVISVKNGS
nr:unnamed protein product [Callosobruchus chinensis]